MLYIEEKGSPPVAMNVSLIDAHHCPGAVMFLWEGYFGQILYTGDFRYHSSMVLEGPLARRDIAIDTLYLDNTYLSPNFEFPSQEDALMEIKRIIESRESFRDCTILVGIDTLGKERLLIDLALYFGASVEVPSDRYMALRIIHAGGGFSDDEFAVFFDENSPPPVRPFKGPLFVLSSRRGIGIALAKRREMLELQGAKTPVLGVIPSGWVSTTQKKKAKHESYSDVYRVPYSIHSSYSEILQLVAAVRPCRVVPIVPDSPCPYNVIAPLLSGSEPRHVDIPVSLHTSSSPSKSATRRSPSPGTSKRDPLLVDDVEVVVDVATAQRKRPKLGVSKAKADLIAADTLRLKESLDVGTAAVALKKVKAENDSVPAVVVKSAEKNRAAVVPVKKEERKQQSKPSRNPADLMKLLKESSQMARASQSSMNK